jgi:glycosyltransferase involved in cell wall biosynthesis
MPYYISAADALVVLGTIRDPQSYWYTSPMKLFEYLLSERPIVASSTPAIREIVTESEVFLYEPDTAASLVSEVRSALVDHTGARTSAAHTLGLTYSWGARAKRITGFLEDTGKKGLRIHHV